MKVTVLLAVSLAFVLTSSWAAPADSYDRYDSIDVDSILRSDRLLTNYIKCLMDKAPCTKEGRSLKEDLPDALETNCGKCSSNQKKMIRKATRHIRDRRPEDWAKLQEKYDPNGKYKESFEKFLNEE